jgi:hypothetical protein
MPNRQKFLQFILGLSILFFSAACNLVLEDEITAIPTADIPTIEFLFPANNQQVVEGLVFDVELLARDTNPGIARVDFYVDDTLIKSVNPVESESETIFTVRMNWRAEGIGLHIFEAMAYRPDGIASDSSFITVEVIARDE